MDKTVPAGLCMALLLPCSLMAASGPNTRPPDTDAIVKAVMDDQYGNGYDTGHRCWPTAHITEKGEALDYCMRPGKIQLTTTAKGRQLYLYAASAYDITDDNRYAYSHDQPGLMGAFKIQLGDKGRWTYLATDPALEFGTNGYCGCNRPRFLKLSNHDDYGWLFSSGGVWQGTVVSEYNILVAKDGGFVDISRIPQVSEAAQDVMYEVAVADHPVNGWFPLSVTRKGPQDQTDHFLVEFDRRQFAYQLPVGH